MTGRAKIRYSQQARVLLLVLVAACRPAYEPRTPPPPPARQTPARPAETTPAPPPLEREFRAAWISPVWGGEWPSRPGMTPAEQRAQLANLLDRARNAGLNAVVLHVRPANDALYASRRAAWSAYLSGTLGRAPQPFYDPLEYAVNEAHARGLELHAWFNPFRASPPDLKTRSDADPATLIRYGTQLWLDPGRPDVRSKVLEDIMEVVERYDIDAVHLDDYFYPYRENDSRGRTLPFPDDDSWERYGKSAGYESRAAWRRANIDDFVQRLYDDVKQRKPWVQVGISPFGIWRANNPPGITGLDAYAEIYADARKWLQQGWLDYLAPQLYWPIDGSQQRFTRLDAWWREQNTLGRHIWPGLQTEQEANGVRGWERGEIARQIDTLRAVRRGTGESLGHIHFRLAVLRTGTRLATQLVSDVYTEPALVPASPWLDARAPAKPKLEQRVNHVTTVTSADATPVRWWVVQYRTRAGWRPPQLHFNFGPPLALEPPEDAEWIAVRALGRTGVESAPAVSRATR